MQPVRSDYDPDNDPEVRATETELRALLQPGGSTDRVWHLIEFSTSYESRERARLKITPPTPETREKFAKLYRHGVQWAKHSQFRTAAAVAAILFIVGASSSTPNPSSPESQRVNLNYIVPAPAEREKNALADQAQITNLILALSSENSREREDAEQSVVAYGPAAIPLLSPLLKSSDAELRTRADELIHRLSAAGDAPADAEVQK